MTDTVSSYRIAYFTGKQGWLTGEEDYTSLECALRAIQDQERDERRWDITPMMRKPVAQPIYNVGATKP